MTNKDHYGDNQNQGEYWNELSGPKWVEEDTAMNIRMSLITDWLFKTTLLQKNQHVLKKNGIKTRKSAINHYKIYGKKNKRIGQLQKR